MQVLYAEFPQTAVAFVIVVRSVAYRFFVVRVAVVNADADADVDVNSVVCPRW